MAKARSEFSLQMGNRLRERREELGLTQKEAARLLDISATFYHDIERGNKSFPIERLILAKERMGADITYLVIGKRRELAFVEEIFRETPAERRGDMEAMTLALIEAVRHYSG